MQAKKSVLMEYPLDNQKRPYKGVFKKMCRRIPGRENHYLGVSSSLWNFAVDLSWLALGYIRYFWSLDTWKDTMWFQGTGGWWGLERPMENSSMRANRKDPGSSQDSEKLPKLLAPWGGSKLKSKSGRSDMPRNPNRSAYFLLSFTTRVSTTHLP